MLSFHLLGLNLKVVKAWKGMWITIVSEIWNLRNNVVFRNNKVHDTEIFCQAQLKMMVMAKT